MKIRPAGDDDFEKVTALLTELGRPRVGEGEEDAARGVYQRQLADPTAAHLVAEEEAGRIVGFLSLHFRERLNRDSDEAWVPDLIVTEPARRRGAARALLAEAERLARERGCWGLTLESGHQRAEAHSLYETTGLTHSGRAYGKLLD